MKSKDVVMKEKERAEKMKALRRELEAELEEKFTAESAQQTTVEIHKIDTNQVLPLEEAKQVIEALLFASSKPLTEAEIRKVVRGYTAKQVEAIVQEIKESYQRENHSFEIVEVAGGYEVATQKKFAPWILKIELQKKVRQATQSALETLAILAYKQPITRAEIESLRGVDVSAVINTLMDRGFVKIVGKKEVAGRPFLYGTTEKFLEHFGLKSLQALPNIEEIKSIVESSVKREDLLGKPQMVENINIVAPEAAAELQSPENQADHSSVENQAMNQEVSNDGSETA